ncbi:MAG: helicase [Gallionellales bacterium 35-53-114]|jgi:ATP-dependent DNA helicase DinG|nr:MAG: helicase [Gallionellales bacterium 35-53-114]OYZ63155.1 MAG: helicase [Gallionellales bacterium 24-53-125]OZB08621.1 MAG: helicase [Gallionellales bacterium 39-52-133]HQS57525.1 ATP-dependent DNA helicase [Gallionellaceae bacterium]HQS74287.1 ATP-dependent DNA helicase [Gallionellaceae bacterium]
MFTQNISALFAPNGALATHIPNFRSRPQQVEMAEAIAEAIEGNSLLIAEAGTGTGKTFAYLVPALLGGGKVVLSTGTKNLQDQLFQRDLPTVRDALKAPVSIALLKGRANYVCHYHLERAQSDGRLPTREDVRHLARIVQYAKITQTGDKSGLADVPETALIWSHVTSTRDNCLGQECPMHKECFVLKARKEAMEADVVVVNHHLFFADVMLRDEGVAELLPACNTVIFDEAHQLPETASLFFGENISTSQLLELARDTTIEALSGAKDFTPLPEACSALEKAARDFRLIFKKNEGRMNAEEAGKLPGFANALGHMATQLGKLNELLEKQAERSEGLENCWNRGVELAHKIKHWQDETQTEVVRWVEIFNHSVQLNTTPLSIADIFAKQIGGTPRAWIFTSATLAVKRDFSHYQGEMGLVTARTACWDSPFNYPEQALLYAPENMPDPNSPAYTEAVVAAALPLLEASKGRAFLLFTSLRAMQRAHEILQAEFDRKNLKYPLMLQGESSRNDLLARFRDHGNAVLLGSQSFWEGVDVRGEALSLVVIDKLPFAPPDDPVLAARIAQITKQGRNAFMEYQLPRAVINLKQGAGRLIRDESDRGVLMICDPRLLSKPYGKRIWQSLPPFKRTRVLAEAVAFFETAATELA